MTDLLRAQANRAFAHLFGNPKKMETSSYNRPVYKQSRNASTSSSSKVQFLPEQSQRYQGMNTLVLDMDETLLHASPVPTIRPDFIVRFPDGARYYVLKRPYVDEFLETMSKIYEIVIYTSGEKEYATQLINYLDPKRHISYILHRGHCINTRKGFEKDLSLIGRDLKNVIFIDNLEENFKRQRDNGIKIMDFYSNRRDEELKKLIPFLNYAATLNEVRPINKIFSDYLVKDLREETPKAKSRQEANKNNNDNPWRRRSIFGDETPKKSSKDKFNATSAVDFDKISTLTSITSSSTDNSSINTNRRLTPPNGSVKNFSLGHLDARMQQIVSLRPTPHNGDVNTPNNRITIEGESNFTNYVAGKIDESPKRIVLEKETFNFKKGKELGSLMSGSAGNVSYGQNINGASSQMIVCNVVGRVNALEKRLKASKKY